MPALGYHVTIHFLQGELWIIATHVGVILHPILVHVNVMLSMEDQFLGVALQTQAHQLQMGILIDLVFPQTTQRMLQETAAKRKLLLALLARCLHPDKCLAGLRKLRHDPKEYLTNLGKPLFLIKIAKPIVHGSTWISSTNPLLLKIRIANTTITKDALSISAIKAITKPLMHITAISAKTLITPNRLHRGVTLSRISPLGTIQIVQKVLANHKQH